MAQNQEIIEFIADSRQFVKNIADMNTSTEAFEKKGVAANTRYQQSLETLGNLVGKTYDKQERAVESYIKSLEKQAAAAGKSGIDKLNAQMEQSIKNYGNSEQAVNRITAAYEKLKKAQEGVSEGNEKYKEFGETIKNAIENPAQAAQGAVTGLLEKLGPLGIALGATVGVAITAGAAVFELSKQFGEFGISMRDLELRTSLNAQQLGEYTYAARAAGTDISIVERLMRGLTNAIEDNSMAGEAARNVLREMGVDIQGVRDGTISVSEVLQQISKAWSENGNALSRNKEAMDLFKRAGIDAIPFLTELNENLNHAKESGFGYKQSMIDAGAETNKQIADMGMHWDNLKHKIEAAAASVLGYITNLAQAGGASAPDYFQARHDAINGVTETMGPYSGKPMGVGGPPAGWSNIPTPAKAAKAKPIPGWALWQGPVYSSEIAQDHALQAMAGATPRMTNAGNNLSDVSDWFKQYEEQQKEQDAAQQKTLSFQEAMIKLQAGPGGELETAKKIYDLRMAAATSTLQQYEAGLDYLKQAAEAQAQSDKQHQDALDKQAKQQQEMLDKENASVAKTASGLFDTLLTHPSQFGKTLGTTLQKKSTQSASDMLGQTVANFLVPGGAKHKDPIEATDINTQATQQNTVAVAQMTAHLASMLGVSPPSVPSGGSGDVPSISIPSISPSSGGSGGAFSIPGFGGGGPFSIPSIVGGPGGTSGFSGPVGGFGRSSGGFNLGSLFGGSSRSGGFSLGGLFGGGSGGGFSLGSLIGRGPGASASSMPGWSGAAAPPPGGYDPGVDVASGGVSGMTAGIGGVAGGLLGSVGTSLAMTGLLGKNAGTGMGILEGAGGGAMIGAQYAGPIGALVGAAAGGLAGLGEMLAGVMSPQAKAKSDVQKLYHININDQMQNQIVSLAQQKYGGNIQIAVASPEVRQMLGVYAAGTGQKSPLSATTPSGGSLVEQGGTLYQGQDYNFGQGYAYQSSLPTLGGNSSTQTLPSPGGSSATNISMNVNGAALASFMTGSYVTPPFVQSQFQASQAASMGRVMNSAVMLDPGMSV